MAVGGGRGGGERRRRKRQLREFTLHSIGSRGKRFRGCNALPRMQKGRWFKSTQASYLS